MTHVPFYIMKKQIITTPNNFRDWMVRCMEKYIIKTPEEFRNFCSKLKPVFSLDTETTSLNYLDLELIGLSLCDGKQACYVVLNLSNKESILELLDYYIQEARIVVFHNFPFDGMVLKKEGIEV